MPHFFIKSESISEGFVIIDDKENYNHIARSLRAKCGEDLLLIDENQIQYETKITDITKDTISAEILKSYKSNRKLPFNLYLVQSPLRSDAQNILIEKATELGAAGVFPVLSDNCALNKAVIDKKTAKWQKIMYEASKQCERADIPKCYELTKIQDLIQNGKFDYVFAFCERLSSKTFRTFFSENPGCFADNSNILVIIGPEGGFSDREFDFFRSNNIPMLTLGNLILKADTAVIVALGNIIYEYYNSFKN